MEKSSSFLIKAKDLLIKRQKYADSIADYPNWRVGLSCAASWSWGISLVVGMATMRTKGILPFMIWTTGNILALPLFGFLRTYFPASRNWLRFIPLLMIFIMMEFFSIIINLQAILSGLGGGIDISSFVFLPQSTATYVVIIIGLFVVWYIHKGGLRMSVLTDIGQYAVQLLAVIFLAVAGYIIGVEKNFLWVQPGGLEWARVGFLGILCGALSIGHQWQRFSSIKEESILRTSLWAGFFFGIYMLFVGLTGLFFTKHIVLGIGFLITMLALATSSIDSGVAGLQYVLGRFKIKPFYASILAVLIIICWPFIVGSTGITKLWTIMALIRSPVIYLFIVLTILVTFARPLQNEKFERALKKVYMILNK